MAASIGIRDARASFSELLERARSGETISITKRGQEIARLVPPEPSLPRQGGWMKGKIWIAPDVDEAWEEVLDVIDVKPVG